MTDEGDGRNETLARRILLAAAEQNMREAANLLACAQDAGLAQALDNAFKGDTARTSLHYAVMYADVPGALGLAEGLLAAGAGANPRDLYGFTPLHWAAITQNGAAMALLLAKGANPWLKDRDGRRPLDYATMPILPVPDVPIFVDGMKSAGFDPWYRSPDGCFTLSFLQKVAEESDPVPGQKLAASLLKEMFDESLWRGKTRQEAASAYQSLPEDWRKKAEGPFTRLLRSFKPEGVVRPRDPSPPLV